MNILKPEEMAGITVEERITKCAYRGIRENRPLKIAVCGQVWEIYLNMLLHRSRPLEVIPSKDGTSARIRVYICGRPLWLVADETKGDDCGLMTWVDE